MSFTLFVAAALGTSSGLEPVDPPQNGEELNAACEMTELTEQRYQRCDSYALYVMMEFAHLGEGSNETGGDLKFCLPRDSLVSVENVQPLIAAYRVQYAREPRAFARVSPYAAFLRAMRREWPCAGGR